MKSQTPDPALALSATPLREFCSFIEWLNLASADLQLGKSLPNPPSLDSPELLRCFKVIHELQGRMIRSDETCAVLEERDLQRTREKLSTMEDSRSELTTKLVGLADAMSSKGLELTQLAAAVKELAGALETSSSADLDSDSADPPAQ